MDEKLMTTLVPRHLSVLRAVIYGWHLEGLWRGAVPERNDGLAQCDAGYFRWLETEIHNLGVAGSSPAPAT